MARRNHHCLFIEEEVYNWSSSKSAGSKRLVFMALLFIAAGILFSVLR